LISFTSGNQGNQLLAVKNAILFAPASLTKFGEEKERIGVEISGEELSAYITLNVKEEELSGAAMVALIKEAIAKVRRQVWFSV
jgi:hypothetical protein